MVGGRSPLIALERVGPDPAAEEHRGERARRGVVDSAEGPMRPIVRLSLLPFTVALLVAACQDRSLPVEPGGISAVVSDGAHGGGNPDFFFLPPLVGDPTSNSNFTAGQFNRRLRPVMAVFKGSDQCSLSNVRRKVFGPGIVPV